MQFQLSKDDCVQKCHNKDLLKNASSICADQTNLLCKAKHDCDQDEVCDCSVKFFCDKKKTEVIPIKVHIFLLCLTFTLLDYRMIWIMWLKRMKQ